MNFKEGDEVRIKKNSGFHNKSAIDNPHNSVIGKIRVISGSYVSVMWPSGTSNSYGIRDLEPATNPVTASLIFN